MISYASSSRGVTKVRCGPHSLRLPARSPLPLSKHRKCILPVVAFASKRGKYNQMLWGPGCIGSGLTDCCFLTLGWLPERWVVWGSQQCSTISGDLPHAVW